MKHRERGWMTLARLLLAHPPMEDKVVVGFRGIEPQEDLVQSAQKWGLVIRAGVTSSCSVKTRVFIDRYAPHWGGSTSVQVDIIVDGQQVTQLASSHDPQQALDGSFTAVAKRLRRLTASATAESIVVRGLYQSLWDRDGLRDSDSSF